MSATPAPGGAQPAHRATRRRTVAVIGGGWAGLAAAVEATRRGDAVTLFEMAPQLGGRARQVDVTHRAASGTGGGAETLALDNGQHILIGAYTETLALARRLGVDTDAALLRLPLAIVDETGRGLRLPAGPPLPAFARAVLGRAGWSAGERLSLLLTASGWALRGFACDDALTVARLCRRLPAAVREEFVDPLCVAALNTPADEASARVFLRVIRDALFAGPGSADLLLPRVSLGALLPQPAARWLTANGARLALGRRVGSVLPGVAAPVSVGGESRKRGEHRGNGREPETSNGSSSGRKNEQANPNPNPNPNDSDNDNESESDNGNGNGKGNAVWHVDGEPFDGVVLAASAMEAARLAAPVDAAWAAQATALRYEPIVTVYLACTNARLPLPMLALRTGANPSRPAGGSEWPAQFVFDHGALSGCRGLLAMVASGAQRWVDAGADATAAAALAQARTLLGRFVEGELTLVRVLVDKRATFRCTPALRRPAGVVAPGLVAAGDYVAGPYPATLEGAVRSGLAAVRALPP